MKLARTIVAGAVIVSAVLPAVAWARSAYDGSGLELSLDVTRDVSDFEYDNGSRVDTRYTQVGARLYETSIPWFQPGLTLGTGWLTPDGDPALEGLQPNGEHLGLLLRSDIPLAAGLSLRGHVAWVYHDLSDSSGDTSVSLEWYDLSARAGMAARLGRVTLEGGATVRSVDGDRRIEGQDTLPFDTRESTGVYARGAVHVDRTGTVDIRIESGARDAATVSFRRRF
ncbi:MAG: hypothetical protein PVH31_01265 [Ectothiorhodospiraceae bacterium]|jgi:hypothetical protein